MLLKPSTPIPEINAIAENIITVEVNFIHTILFFIVLVISFYNDSSINTHTDIAHSKNVAYSLSVVTLRVHITDCVDIVLSLYMGISHCLYLLFYYFYYRLFCFVCRKSSEEYTLSIPSAILRIWYIWRYI